MTYKAFGGFGGPEIAMHEAGIGNALPPPVYRAMLKSLGLCKERSFENGKVYSA